jgi:CubicO group peptidase (beta-lactamase class C family)
MSFQLRIFAAAAISSTVLSSAHAYEGFTAVGPKGKQIVSLVREAEVKAGFSGAVLAAENGKLIAAVAVGKNGKQPLEVTTLFELASCTKPFTAIAVMKLVEEGKLKLDDPIAKYLPGIPEDCQAITIRHLLQHTSGIPGSNSAGHGTDLAQVLPTFLEGGPRTPPGERHEYWNQGYALLSEVIARASGKSYVTTMRTEVFKPCQMENSRFTGDRPPRGAKVATGMSTRGEPRTALEHPYGEYGFQYRGMGGLVTNLVDLWKWDRTLAAGKLLTADSIAEMTKPGEQGYALGWRVHDEDGHTIHEHTGSVRGFLALVRRVPETDSCLFVLANSDDKGPFGIVCQLCKDVLAGREAKLVVPAAPEGELTDSLLGTYRDEQGRTFTVERDGKQLAAAINWHGPISYGHLNQGEGDELTFDMSGSSNKIAVERGADGTVTALTITDLGSPIKFVRVIE